MQANSKVSGIIIRTNQREASAQCKALITVCQTNIRMQCSLTPL